MAKQKPITDEIAGVEKDIFGDYLAFGNLIQNPDKVLRSEAGGKGVELYEDLLRDDQVAADMDTRRKAVIGREWDVLPASDKRADVKIAEYVKQALTNCGHDSARKSLLAGLVLGYKPAEIIWDYSEGDIFIKEIIPRSSRRFVFGKDRLLRLLTPTNMIEGEIVPEKKFQIFVAPCDNGSPYGQGLGRSLYWPVWFKKNGIKFWMIFSDKFGSPTVIGKYPPGTLPEQQTKLMEVCETVQQESSIIIPNTMLVELLEAARTSSVNNYDTLCKYMDGKITLLILGHSGATQSTPGKLGGEDRAQDVQNKNLKYDADLLCEQENNQLIKWITDYNFPGVKQYPKLWIETEEEKDLNPHAERDQILVNIGVPISERYFYDTYGQDMKPEEGEMIVKPAPPPNPFGAIVGANGRSPLPAFTECSCGRNHKLPRPQGEGRGEGGFNNFAESAWVSEYMQRLAPALQGAQQSAIDEITTWLKAQDTPPTSEVFNTKTQNILGSAYANIDTAEVAGIVADMYGTFKSSLPIAAEAASAFGGADVRAIQWLSDVDSMFYSKFITNPDATDAITRFLNEQYLKGGQGLFGRGDPAVIEEFRNLLAQKTGEISSYQAQRIADTSVQRIRGFAHISQMNDAAIPAIQIIEPTEECDFCRAMNGKIIQVDTAYNLMQDLTSKTPDEYLAYLQENTASLDNIAQFVDTGALPPYHPNCHGYFVKA